MVAAEALRGIDARRPRGSGALAVRATAMLSSAPAMVDAEGVALGIVVDEPCGGRSTGRETGWEKGERSVRRSS